MSESYWVVVVDDDTFALKTAKNLLGSEKIRVSAVKSGQDLLSFLKKNNPDLILLDVVMPEMDGFETYRKLREDEQAEGRRQVPVIFLSGENDSSKEHKGLLIGASDFIRKPINPDIVLARIRNTIANRETIENLTEEATIDQMTGFYNKASAEERVMQTVESGNGILLVVDLDNFKLVNDMYGHDMGDRVLRAFSVVAKKNTRSEDVLCRIGGDEFLIYIKGTTDKEVAHSLTKRLNEGIVRECHILMGDGFEIPIGVSSGGVIVPAGGDYESLYHLADKALYDVKRNGKHGCAFYDDEQSEDRDELKQDLLNDTGRVRMLFAERGKKETAMVVGQDAFTWIYRHVMRSPGGRDSALVVFSLKPSNGDENPEEEVVDSFLSFLQSELKADAVIHRLRPENPIVLIPGSAGRNPGSADGPVSEKMDRIIKRWKMTEGYDDTEVKYGIN